MLQVAASPAAVPLRLPVPPNPQECALRAHIACRPAVSFHEESAGCFLVCREHGIRQSFGFVHGAAASACVAHNLAFHS